MLFIRYYFSRIISIALLLNLMLLQQSCAQESTLVKTNKGFVKGINEAGSLVFKGMPYAQPPVGALRFKAPLSVLPWADTLACDKFGSAASQYNNADQPLKGAENCLSLNIYTPLTDAKAKMPVVVWVHGGAMTSGSGMSQNGHAFADRDSIVTITINYRLGALGFLYLGDVNPAYKTSGNNGLLDLIMALKWVKENIRYFGGDPSRVTVMGESAGAKLASTLLVSPAARGLFGQLVLESGGVQCIRDTVTAKAIRKRILNELHLRNPADLLNLPVEQLIAAQAKVCNGAVGTNYFGPVNDGVMIAGDPYQEIAKKKNKGVRFLIGSNKREALLFMNMDKRLFSPDRAVLQDWFGENYPFVLSAYQQSAKQIGQDSAAVSVLSQYMYIMHSYRLAEALAQAGNPVWAYRFDYSKDGKGATHGQELPYIWDVPQVSQQGAQEAELAMQMHSAWVNFIKGNKPGKVNYTDWPPYQGLVRTIMVFDRNAGSAVLPKVYNDTAYPSAGFILH